mgnify:CR=1 FL=1
MLLLRSARSRLLLNHRAIAHSLHCCSKYEEIVVERPEKLEWNLCKTRIRKKYKENMLG